MQERCLAWTVFASSSSSSLTIYASIIIIIPCHVIHVSGLKSCVLLGWQLSFNYLSNMFFFSLLPVNKVTDRVLTGPSSRWLFQTNARFSCFAEDGGGGCCSLLPDRCMSILAGTSSILPTPFWLLCTIRQNRFPCHEDHRVERIVYRKKNSWQSRSRQAKCHGC